MLRLVGWLEHIGLSAVFGFVLIEQLGLPLPSYPLLVIAGAWSMQGGPSTIIVTAVAVCAALLADLGWYGVGQRLGSRVLRLMCMLSLTPDSCVADTERVFARFGTRVLLVAKFVPGLGAVATAMSGVVEASLLGFVVFDVIGSIVWAGSGVAIGALFHDAVEDVFAELATLGRTGLWLLVLLIALFLVLRLWRRHTFLRELRGSRISVEELFQLLTDGRSPMIVDARPPASRIRDGIIPGAIAFETLGVEGIAVEVGREVVVYCACPNEATAARLAKRLIAMGFERVRPPLGGIHAWVEAGYTIERT